MPKIRSRNDWLSRALAIVIAYAFAMQMLLGGIVATRMAVAAPLGSFTICSSETPASPEKPDQPAQPHRQAPCSICAFASLSPPLPILTAQPSILVRLANVGKRPEAATLIARRSYEPRSSQGPPRIS